MTDALTEIIKQALKASDAHKRASSMDELERLMAEDIAAALLSAPLSDRLALAERLVPWRSDLDNVPNDSTLVMTATRTKDGIWTYESWAGRSIHEERAKVEAGIYKNSPHLIWVPDLWREHPTNPSEEEK